MTPGGENPSAHGRWGDPIAARRARWSFRFIILALVVFTGGLWLSENFLRHDLGEAQFRSALTLPTPSARPILRQVVKRDRETKEFPTRKYLQALAEREEDDLILPTYKDAYALDSDNADLAIRYGNQLMIAGYYKEARERYHEAAINAPENALPSYLEAAALQRESSEEDGFGAALALIAKTNNSGKVVTFPQPVWAPELSKDGYWYAGLRREAVGECLGPILFFVDAVLMEARSRAAAGNLQILDYWLKTIQDMGTALARGQETGAPQAMAGLRIHQLALDGRRSLRELMGQPVEQDMVEMSVRVGQALEAITAFESSRDTRIQAERAKFRYPLIASILQSFLLLGVFSLIFLISKAAGEESQVWRAGHTRLGVAVLAAGATLFFLILMGFTAGQFWLAPDSVFFPWMQRVWWLATCGLLVFGVMYPFQAIPRTNGPARGAAEGNSPEAPSGWPRGAYWVMLRRYFGILCGLALADASVWFIFYRIITSHYPYQLEILVTGFTDEEVSVVQRALSLIG